MSTKLSFSQVNTYTTCGRKYELHYVKKYREKYIHSALLYGSAIDAGLNTLLGTRDLNQALQEFDKAWNFQHVNNKLTSLSDCEDLVYAEKDFDEELLSDSDFQVLSMMGDNVKENVLPKYNLIKEKKSKDGFDNLTSDERKYYNFVNWLCLKRKGHVMIESYNKKILPKIKRVLAIQHRFQLENGSGDIILAVADFICEWEDGSIILLDNKTSSRQYEEDQAARSAQLIVYYHKLKEEFKLDKVGFVVMNKNINKNRRKVCSKCGFDGTGGRHKTCPEMTYGTGNHRCNGEWLESIDPDCMIQTVFDYVTDSAEELVLTAFDEANTAIKQGNFYKNLNACKQGSLICPFYRYCWFGDESDIVKLDQKQ